MSVSENQVNSDEEYLKKCWKKRWSKRYVVIEWDLHSFLLYSYIDTQLMTYTGFHDNLIDCLKSTKTIYTSAYKIVLSRPHIILVGSDEPITNLSYPELFI